MNVATQLSGERIARQVTARSAALEVLAERPSKFGLFYVAVTAIATSIGGIAMVGYFLNAVNADVRIDLWFGATVGAVLGIAIAVAAGTCKEVVSLRRRLNAALVLLRAHDEQLNRR